MSRWSGVEALLVRMGHGSGMIGFLGANGCVVGALLVRLGGKWMDVWMGGRPADSVGGWYAECVHGCFATIGHAVA